MCWVMGCDFNLFIFLWVGCCGGNVSASLLVNFLRQCVVWCVCGSSCSALCCWVVRYRCGVNFVLQSQYAMLCGGCLGYVVFFTFFYMVKCCLPFFLLVLTESLFLRPSVRCATVVSFRGNGLGAFLIWGLLLRSWYVHGCVPPPAVCSCCCCVCLLTTMGYVGQIVV